jgi:hypothetical protein
MFLHEQDAGTSGMHGDVVNAVADLGIRVGNVWRVPAAVDRHTWQEVAGLRGHGTGPMWQPGAGGLCFAYDYFGSEGCEADVSSPSRRRGRSERTTEARRGGERHLCCEIMRRLLLRHRLRPDW